MPVYKLTKPCFTIGSTTANTASPRRGAVAPTVTILSRGFDGRSDSGAAGERNCSGLWRRKAIVLSTVLRRRPIVRSPEGRRARLVY